MTNLTMVHVLSFLISFCYLFFPSSAIAQVSTRYSPEQLDFFEAKIRPVLVSQCYKCHSEEHKTSKGGLKLDSREAILTGGDSGPALVPGQPSESLILSAIKYEDLQMPPKQKLASSTASDFQRWIEMGAPDPRSGTTKPRPIAQNDHNKVDFWAFKPPINIPPPTVSGSHRINNDIDRFVLSSLNQKKLTPAKSADKRILIRRAYYDLIGLPPEPEAVEKFVNDSSPKAFEKVVDELLASPHYGERWGRYWLDLARYAEDQAHTFKARMYPRGYLYRDWVVRSLNDDMPYNQFLKLQIAGDQLKTADAYQHRAALGLFALGPVYYQDNGEKDKAIADEWDDRVDTLMRGTQALTVACARCHDHKYDPISMKDYYGLAGVFASSDYAELPAVPQSVISARESADAAVALKQLEIDGLLNREAPSVRVTLAPRIPDYLKAAWLLHRDHVGKNVPPNQIKKAAAASGLDDILLGRWVAWIREEKGSGATSAKRSYLDSLRELKKSAPIKSTPADTEKEIAQIIQIGQKLKSDVQPLLSQRQMLTNRFGDQYAFIASEDRANVTPGEIPLGNLFDDEKSTPLSSALASDPFRSVATSKSLGVHKVNQGWGDTTAIADGVRFSFKALGSDKNQHGQIVNDAWGDEGGIRTTGKSVKPNLPRTEQGIGMHANALITFDLDEIRQSGLIPPNTIMQFRVDRAGLNDDSFGQSGSVHIAVILSKPQKDKSRYDSIIASYINGKPAKAVENDTLYSFAGPVPEPLKADGKFASFDVPIPPETRYLTIVSTGAQISETENTINSDHAVLSGARLSYLPDASALAFAEQQKKNSATAGPELDQLRTQAILLSEMFDERGLLGLPAAKAGDLLKGSASQQLTTLKQELTKLKSEADRFEVLMAHSLADSAEPRDLKVFMAGDPKKLGDTAVRSFLNAVNQGKRKPFNTTGSGRLDLAEAIASPENPLTARVIVNRIWAGHFGFGLVRTLNNFGQLGDRPSHPELLDYLATRLVNDNWSLKSLHRLIMLSATWQQDSQGDPANQEIDADNRYLWRMNRRRLEIEPWRDSLLSVSGQLDRQIGGPSKELTGENRRRTLYGYVSRHRLNDLLRLFDFPDPNITAGERAVTTVPLQQLFVLNSEFMLNQAKSFAARLTGEAPTDEARIQRAFALLYGRKPSSDELTELESFLKMAKENKSADSLSALQQLCLALLGTNEFAYVD